jgi:predicted nucleic acid-binding protein
VPYLFDTDAVSELLKPRPNLRYADWVRSLPWREQFISAVSLGELLRGAYMHSDSRFLNAIEQRVLSAVTVLPFDTPAARIFGWISSDLRRAGTPLEDADLQIAATAIRHGLELVTGNIRHFSRVPGLVINPVLAVARR